MAMGTPTVTPTVLRQVVATAQSASDLLKWQKGQGIIAPLSPKEMERQEAQVEANRHLEESIQHLETVDELLPKLMAGDLSVREHFHLAIRIGEALFASLRELDWALSWLLTAPRSDTHEKQLLETKQAVAANGRQLVKAFQAVKENLEQAKISPKLKQTFQKRLEQLLEEGAWWLDDFDSVPDEEWAKLENWAEGLTRDAGELPT